MESVKYIMWLHGKRLVQYLDVFLPGWEDTDIDKSGINVHVQVGPGWLKSNINEEDAYDFPLLALMRLICTGGNVHINFVGFNDYSDQMGALTSSVGYISSDKAKVMKGYKTFAKLDWTKALEENTFSAVDMKFVGGDSKRTRIWEFLIVVEKDFMPSWLTLDERGLKVANKASANKFVERLGFRHDYDFPPFGMTLGLPSEAGYRFQRIWETGDLSQENFRPDIWHRVVKNLQTPSEGRWMRPYSKDKRDWYYVTEG